MRICHIVEAAGGGTGQVLIDLIKSNIDAGADVSLVYSPNRIEPCFGASLAALGDRIKLYAIPMKRSVGAHDAVSAWRLLRLLRRIGPFDIIHSHSSKAGALARIAGFFLPDTVQIYTPHAFVTMAPATSPLYRWVEWLLCWLATAIICTSPTEKKHATEHLKIPPRKLHLIMNGVPLDYPATRPEARARMGFGDGDFVVGFVGRLVDQKNPTRLVEAFAAAAQENPRLRLAIVGEGPLRRETEQQLAARGLLSRTCFLGGTNGKQLMPGFDCLVCSSDYESFGLVILEAMAAGVPVVSTPVGIAEDAVIPGKAGYVTKDFEARSLAIAIASLAAASVDVRVRMAKETKGLAEDFSINRMAVKTMHLYANLVAQQRA